MSFIRIEGTPVVAFSMLGDPLTVNISGSSGATGSPLAGNSVYRLWASIDCFVKFGDIGVTASTSDHPLTAKIPEYITIKDGSAYCAVISSSASGILFLSQLG